MTQERGKFIVLEGADKTGKTTQHALLAERIEKELGLVVAKFDFPQYESTFSGRFVARFLNGEFGKLDQIDPHLAAIPFAVDRFEAAPKIRKALAEGAVVLANRYVKSNKAHQGAKVPYEKRDEFFDFLDELEYKVLGIPKADLNIVLRVDAGISQELMEAGGRRSSLHTEIRDIQEADLDHQRRAADLYVHLAARYPESVVLINCLNPDGKLMDVESIHNLVWQEALKILKPELVEGQIRKERQS